MEKIVQDLSVCSLKEIADGSRMLTEKEAARVLNCGRSTLAKYRSHGLGPHYFKLGRSVRYHINDLLDYMQSKKVETDGGY